ncbi:stage III sporulation protein AH [Alkalibacillus flavidus]|uniref:Stage III sporulation protein AH n=1 Tax=Alkalibacillus flavidus TaxID=546021 RepID=A0ABV2KY43_9BACI
MVLRKQTVWLITMLSLLIVLSVYYLMSPGSEEVALIPDEDEERQEIIDGEDGSEGGQDSETEGQTSSTSTDGLDVDVSVDELTPHELFTTIRLEKQDTRSELKEQLSSIVASSTATTAEKNEAMEEMYALQTVAQKETILEEMIIQEKGYQDVLVRTDDDVVQIRVIAEELSSTDANHIMQLARDEFADLEPRVRLQDDA